MVKNKNDISKINEISHLPFQHLAPLDSIDDKTTFFALDYALSQREVKNIALTGVYGSGKSSILRTYKKAKENNKDDKHKFLNISLATFALEQKEGKSSDEIPETTMQKIEKSILQQIFYRKSGFQLPFSRFKRIRNLPLLLNGLICIPIIIVLAYFSRFVELNKQNLFYVIKSHLLLQSGSMKIQFLAWLFFLSIVLGLFFFIRFLNKLKINKFGFQFSGIGLDAGEPEQSLLNKYLDEVLYFFEVTDVDVVMFEDLDRFKNTEIFTKLRELNALINNYEKISKKKRVVFIYALRDEVFKDTSRTKFFDFIIPVIPIIDSQNAGDFLVKRKQELGYEAFSDLDEEFLYDIGLYVNDMRLLLNCINEFIIYNEKISQNENYNKNNLFALILYKNLYPKDFADLSQCKGYLYSIISAKTRIINERRAELESEKEKLNEKLQNKREQIARDISQLRILYVTEILKISTLYTNNRAEQYIAEQDFEDLRKNNKISINYQNLVNYRNVTQSQEISFSFADIENKVDPKHSYEEKLRLINISESEIKKEIEDKKLEIEKLSRTTLADIANDKEVLIKYIDAQNNINFDFILYLLKNAWIDENYFYYTSYFYEGSITGIDRQYLLLIKNNKLPGFSLEINQKEQVIKRISDSEWGKPAILNNSLLTFLLETKNKRLDVFIKTMWAYDKKENRFFRQYDCPLNMQKRFYTELYRILKSNIFYLFEDDSILGKFLQFFISVDVDETDYEICNKFVKSHINFLYKHIDDDIVGQIVEKIKKYNIKLNLKREITEFAIFEKILENNLYEITKENLCTIIKKKLNLDESIVINDYLTKINETKNEKVKNYVCLDINTTVKNILLPLGNELSESESVSKELLNSTELEDSLKESLIQFNKIPISEISQIILSQSSEENPEKINLWDVLFKNSKVVPTWNNLLDYFKNVSEETLNEILVVWLNNDSNCDALSKEKPLTEEEVNDKENEKRKLVHSFYSVLLDTDSVNIEVFKMLFGVCPWSYSSLNHYDIDQNRLKFLIAKGKLSFSEGNYSGLKSIGTDIFVLFICRNFEYFIKTELECVALSDLILCLNDKVFDNDKQTRILQAEFTAWQNLTDERDFQFISKKILELNITEKNNYIPIEKLANSLNKDNTTCNELLKFILLQSKNLNAKNIDYLLSEMGKGYSALSKRNRSYSLVKNTDENKELLDIMLGKGMISSFNKYTKEPRFRVNYKRGKKN